MGCNAYGSIIQWGWGRSTERRSGLAQAKLGPSEPVLSPRGLIYIN
jgi:hypothetical protein